MIRCDNSEHAKNHEPPRICGVLSHLKLQHLLLACDLRLEDLPVACDLRLDAFDLRLDACDFRLEDLPVVLNNI